MVSGHGYVLHHLPTFGRNDFLYCALACLAALPALYVLPQALARALVVAAGRGVVARYMHDAPRHD